MQVEIASEHQRIVDEALRSGRYGSAEEVIAVGLRLLEEQERKFADLRRSIQEALAEGGEVTDEELDEALAAASEELRRAGIPD
ncbi:MAG: type II toxin-antitoxin system ParD family antitoxin [Rhodospirillales bacterium]|jgi:antitoxin ParD1/3/4